jgi:hypothetical protein
MGDTLNYESFHFVSIHKISLRFLYERLTSINYYKVRQNLKKNQGQCKAWRIPSPKN